MDASEEWEKMAKEMGYGPSYELRLFCSNCGASDSYMIPMGNTFDSVTCKTCGCKRLQRKRREVTL